MVARGELWWGESPDEKGRPYLVVSRDAANAVMARVLVAPITSRIRSIPSELAVGHEDGLPFDSVASFDNLRVVPKAYLVDQICALRPARLAEACAAAQAAIDC